MSAPSTPEHEAGAAPATDQAAASPAAGHASPVTEASESSGKATASLVLGILGLIAAAFIPLAGWILGGIALGLGLSARSQIRRRGVGPMGMATAGAVLGGLAIVVGIVIVALVASSIS